jgi:hypothetical protein
MSRAIDGEKFNPSSFEKILECDLEGERNFEMHFETRCEEEKLLTFFPLS